MGVRVCHSGGDEGGAPPSYNFFLNPLPPKPMPPPWGAATEKFISEMYLRQPGYMYSACGPFTKNKESMQKSKEIRDKFCFQHDIVMEILRICLEEQLLIRYYMITHLVLLKIQNINDNMDLLLWF